MAPESLCEAIRYWEPRRIWYNLALIALAGAWVQQSSFNVTWRQWRWALWLLGTLFALLIAYYWIADEIYPSVGAA